ncbi:hypothetical protein C8A01DRAFT_37960 [Parachaetomium inaequale]|uniref:Uncharacterized protein n=1 Tax=Parachaetomium inaequale TaxID=2588326 RepID=A0AAN6SQ38_9PEZI|nr:hypothetical protein C8A01DRAFT_37960 [Parachaetomium inaequale]
MFVQPPWTMQYRMNYTRGQVTGGPKPSGRPPKAPARVPEGQFDPDDLTRRLYVVLAEQKALAERKRRARGEGSSRKDGLGPSSSTRHREARQRPAEPPVDLITELRRTESAKHKPSSHTAAAAPAPDSQSEAYHHVPQEAAKQFTRTTTVENMRDSNLIHKLSKHALKFHLDGPRATRPDHEQQKHTFEDELSRILPSNHHSHSHNHNHNHNHNPTQSKQHARRNSTGNAADLSHHPDGRHHLGGGAPARHSLLIAPDTLAMDTLLEDVTTPPPEELGRFPPADRRVRVDWTQSDEQQQQASCGGGSGSGGSGVGGVGGSRAGGPKLLLLSPLLRKADSFWMLKVRRGSKDSAGSASSSVGGETAHSPTTPTAAKAGKGGFFGRFKR